MKMSPNIVKIEMHLTKLCKTSNIVVERMVMINKKRQRWKTNDDYELTIGIDKILGKVSDHPKFKENAEKS